MGKKIDECKHSVPDFYKEDGKVHVRHFCSLMENKEVSEAKCEECEHFKSRFIEFPITVNQINTDSGYDYYKEKVGKLVKIRPCAEEYENKTYLGLFLGSLPTGTPSVSYNRNTQELNVRPMNNPAVFVFDLNKIIYGYESFWGFIENPEEVKEITDDDIDNIWYMKLLRKMNSDEE